MGARLRFQGDQLPFHNRFLRRFIPMAKYGSSAQKEVKQAMHEFKEGTLKSRKSKKKVKSHKQAIAVGLSKARKKGAKVPARSKS